MENIKKFEVKCIGINDTAQGEAFIDKKKKVLVPYLLPKEIGVIEYDKYTERCKLVKLLRESNIRQNVDCKIYQRCGSCQILHMNYNEGLSFKKDLVNRLFKENKINYSMKEIIESNKKDGYRNKMQVAYKLKDGKIVYGFYEEESHRVIPLEYCKVQSERQNEIAGCIAKIIKDLNITPYNEDKRTGVIRFALIREAFSSGEVLVTIVTNGEMFPARSEFIKRLRDKCPYVTTIIQNYNSRKTSIILGDQERVLYGPGFIEDKLCGNNYRISSKTFYQVNPLQAEKLYNKVIEFGEFNKDDVVIDAYCGVGTIGMAVARHVKEVIGVENNKQSVQYAKMNANYNKIKNIQFVLDDATNYLVNLAKANAKVDCIIMDPPRSGSTVSFLNAIKKLKPRKVIYVSCDPHTLARDLKELLGDYNIDKGCLVDMFVWSYHVEAVCCLLRRGK